MPSASVAATPSRAPAKSSSPSQPLSIISFSALGTEWSVAIDAAMSSRHERALRKTFLEKTTAFDERCSRFIPTSEARSFRNAQPGEYQVSEQFAEILCVAQDLKRATDGAYDPAIGGLLELAGYDETYSFRPDPEKIAAFEFPEWSISGTTLKLGGGVVFDIGGIGKGYWIDQIAAILRNAGHDFFLVDGGGDMFGTCKLDGSPWQIALEWPGDESRAIGRVELADQGLAISDIFKRAWSHWHHLLQTENKRPTREVRWAAAIAPTAWEADQATAALSLSWQAGAKLAQEKGWQYAGLLKENQMIASRNWLGEWFSGQ